MHDSAQTIEIEVGGRFVLNNVGMLRRLATLDQGIVLLAEEIVADDLAAAPRVTTVARAADPGLRHH